MGLFSKILPAVEGIAGVVLMATGVGVVAGAMLLTSALAQSGIIGGSVGKFLNSGVGQGLMAAVGLGATAYAYFGSSVLGTAETAAAQTTQNAATATSSAAAQDASVAAQGAAGTSDIIPTANSISSAAGIDTQSFVSAEAANANGVNPALLAGPQATIDPVNPTGAPLAAQQATQQATNDVAAASGQSMPGEGAEGGPSGTLPSTPTASGAQPSDLTGVTPPGANAYKDLPLSAGTDNGGMLGKAGALLNTKAGAALVQGAGSAIGGVGQGIMQKQATQDMINAQQWGDKTFSNPQLNAQVQGAAAAPITVPQGYLQRAQALKAMLQGGGTQGVQPTTPPPTMGGAPNGGPVPVLGMNSTPRGGVVGG